MTAATPSQRPSGAGATSKTKGIIGVVVVIAVLVAMGLDTTVVTKGSSDAASSAQFSAKAYGKKEFPKVRKAITQRAAPAPELASAIQQDKGAAVDKYGVPGNIAPVMSVKLTGVVGQGESGIFHIKVDGVPRDLTIRLVTGPAITGTVLRDGAGNIDFGDFENQIQYQNAGAAINDAMKKQVLAGLDRDHLKGKTVHVIGAFQLINPDNWLVTPVSLSVQK